MNVDPKFFSIGLKFYKINSILLACCNRHFQCFDCNFATQETKGVYNSSFPVKNGNQRTFKFNFRFSKLHIP